jgi:hypothetical protein
MENYRCSRFPRSFLNPVEYICSSFPTLAVFIDRDPSAPNSRLLGRLFVGTGNIYFDPDDETESILSTRLGTCSIDVIEIKGDVVDQKRGIKKGLVVDGMDAIMIARRAGPQGFSINVVCTHN